MIEKVGQIAIAISDLETSVKFYRDTLGLELLFEVPPGLAFFNCGGDPPYVNHTPRSGTRPQDLSGVLSGF